MSPDRGTRYRSGAARLLGPIVALSTLLVAVVVVEIVLTLFFPVPDPYELMRYDSPPNQYIRSEFEPGYRLEIDTEEGLPGMQGPNLFTTNNLGYRGGELKRSKPSDEFRIFMIGGSTTICTHLDDSESLDAIVQAYLAERSGSELSIRVYNAGKAGDAIDDHTSMLVHRIVHLEPDLITVFAGANDLTRAIYGYDYLHRAQVKGGRKLPLLMLLATEFQLPRRVYYLVKRFAPTERDVQEKIGRVTNFAEKVELRKSVPVSDREPAMDLEAYEAYLRTLVGVARAHGIALVFMTQASSWNSAVDPEIAERHWMLYRFGVTYREEAMERALEAYNDVMRRIAREFDVPLYDLARHIPKSSEYFYDDFHFNVGGAAAAGRALAAFLIESGLVPEQLPAPGR